MEYTPAKSRGGKVCRQLEIVDTVPNLSALKPAPLTFPL